MARVKEPKRQLESKTPWKLGEVYYHRGKKIECKSVQGGRYWGVMGYLDRSPDQAMDRVEGKSLQQIMFGTRPETVAGGQGA